jgi:Tfp pilus assembly protein PilF
MRHLFATLLLAAAASAGLDDALAKFGEGKYRDALDAAEAVPEDAAEYAKARYLMGEIFLALGEPADAEEALRGALRKKPGSEPVLTALGRALLEQDRAAEAVAELEKAAAANAKSARAAAFLGVARLRATDGKEGGKDLARGLKLGAEDPEVARAAVAERLRSGDLAEARKAAKAFAGANKKHPMGPFLEALVAEREKEYDAAIAAYANATKLDDTFLDAHKNLAILCIAQNPVYSNKERTALAMKHFQRYVDLGGQDREVISIYETLKQVLPTLGR